ncbi:MAG: type II CAAX endopeptidase family protein [Pyrinomonadaceae bacterium]
MASVNEPSPSEGIRDTDHQPGFLTKPTPANPPWSSLIAILVWIASVVLIALIPLLFLLPYVISQGPAFSERQALAEFLKNDTTSLLLQIVAIIPAHILTLVLSWAVVTKLNKFSFRETLGWKSGGMRWPHYIGILVVFFAVAMVVGNYFPEQENELTRILQSSRWAVFLVAFMATFTAPVVEEVIYRGILYSAFQKAFGIAPAIIVVTLLFALVHVPQYYPSYSTIFLLLLLSLILTLVRSRTGNLLPCIILHTIFNGTQSILLILEPYMKSQAPVIEPTATFFLK